MYIAINLIKILLVIFIVSMFVHDYYATQICIKLADSVCEMEKAEKDEIIFNADDYNDLYRKGSYATFCINISFTLFTILIVATLLTAILIKIF